jgi:hypothetical protein
MRFRGLILTALFCLVAVALSLASATDVYITPDGNPLSGSVCTTNTHNPAWFNTGGNWGTGTSQIGPGTKVHLCGTISSQLAVQSSGASGSPITVFFEPGAKISLPACDNTNGCLNLDGKSYLVIDGGTPCGPGTACNAQEIANPVGTPQTGTIENTLNGTPGASCSGGACTLQVSSRNISAINAKNFEIKNLIIRNNYIHVACPGTDSSTKCVPNLSSDGGFVSFQDTNSVSALVHDSTFHDGRELVTIAPTGSAVESGFRIYNNDISRTAGGIKIANSAGPATITALSIHDNRIHDLANWDAYDCVHAYHLDGIHMWGLGGAVNSNVDFYNNLIDGNFGGCQTGTVFFEGENQNVKIYNNVIKTTYTQNNNGMINVNGTGFEIYNNTISGADSGGDLCFNVGRPSGSPSIKFVNNIVTGCNTLVLTQNSPTITSWDNNVYGQCSNTGCNSNTPFVVNGSSFYNFTQFKAVVGDAHSSFGAGMTYAALNPNGSLQSTSPAVAAKASPAFSGNNLASLSIIALNSDTTDGGTRTAVSRPIGSTLWDAGAYTYTTSSGSTLDPASGLVNTVR